MQHTVMFKLYKSLSVLLVIFLFSAGNTPAASNLFPGIYHWLAHLTVYAFIGFTVGMGWRELAWGYIAAVVSAIGVLHEMTEIIFHGHSFEKGDALINMMGAVMGATAVIALRKITFQKSG